MLKKAMIMSAGVGSRLGALSSILPKPLVPVANVPAMDILIKHISSYGIKKVIANTYYRALDIQNRYKNNEFGVDFNYIEEKELSGTAGGLKKCARFFDNEEDFIVLSGDALTDINIQEAYESHKKSNAIATIVTKKVNKKDVNKYGIIVTDEKGFVTSFQEKPKIEDAESDTANTGIYIFKNDIFNFIPSDTFYDFAKNVFPSILSENIKINTYNMKGYWSDIGSLEQYKQSNFDIINHLVKSYIPQVRYSKDGKYISGGNCIIPANCILKGNNVIGNNCIIGENCTITDSVIWDNVKIKDNITIKNSIILEGSVITDSISDEIITKEDKEKIPEVSV